jgi:cell division protein FtsB
VSRDAVECHTVHAAGLLRDVAELEAALKAAHAAGRESNAKVATFEHTVVALKNTVAEQVHALAKAAATRATLEARVAELETGQTKRTAELAKEKAKFAEWRGWVRAERSEKFSAPPSYWSPQFHLQHGSGGGGSAALSVTTRVPVPELVGQLQDVISHTFLADRLTRDRRSPMPTGLKVVHVLRNENVALWDRFATKRGDIYDVRYRQKKLDEKGVPGPGGTRTRVEVAMPHLMQSTVSTPANEFYLFHGTSPDGAQAIFETGFDVELAGSAAGAAFGKGSYFAECSSKSDEYAKEGTGIMGKGQYALLLCRVVCGNMRYVTNMDTAAHSKTTAPEHHSLLGDREAAVGTYREFIVYDGKQVYPEFAIIYERVTA